MPEEVKDALHCNGKCFLKWMPCAFFHCNGKCFLKWMPCAFSHCNGKCFLKSMPCASIMRTSDKVSLPAQPMATLQPLVPPREI